MKTSLIFIVAATLLLSAAIIQAEPLTVAVYDFKGVGKNGGDLDDRVTALVTANLATETNLVMVERSELNKALGEQAFGISGMVSSDAAAKIGEITGAKVLVAGQVLRTGDNLIIIADIIGTETGRLFAEKVQGSAERLGDLTTDLSGKVARTISLQATNLIGTPIESRDERLEQIVKSINGTNRPSVSVSITLRGGKLHPATCEDEFGAVLLKAGFPVVDAKSDHKPDIEVVGIFDLGPGPRRNGLSSTRAVVEIKVRDRATGNFIAFDRQDATATDVAGQIANRTALVNAVDTLSERLLPLLANYSKKQN